MNKIGYGQFAIILAVSRVLSEAAAIPETTLEYGVQRYCVILLSFALTLIAYLPICLMIKYTEGRGIVAAAGSGSRVTACVICVILSVGIVAAMTETFTRISLYAASTIFDAAPSPLLFITIALICLYALSKGLEAAARVGVLTAAGYLLLIILTVIALIPSMRLDRAYIALPERPDGLIDEVIAEFSRNSEIIIFAALAGRARGNLTKSVLLYVGMSAAALLLMTFLYNTVLGEYLSYVNFPFYSLASLSDVAVFQRLNGVDVMIWVLAACVKLTLLSLSARESVQQSFGGKRLPNIIAGVMLAASAGIAYLFVSDAGLFKKLVSLLSTGIPLLILAVPLPLIAMTAAALGRRKEHFTK